MSLGDDMHRTILESLSDGVYFVDRRRRITYWNKGAARLTGFSAAEATGRRCADGLLMHTDDDGDVLCGRDCPLLATMRDGKPRECHVFMHHKDGHRQPVWVRAAPIHDDEGRIVGAVETFNDESDAVAVRQRLGELEHQALSDHATGVGNRRHIEASLRSRLDEHERYGWPFGVLFVDIDRFKAVNDRHGHETGDRVLRMVATTLGYAGRASDSVGRWGGEEFVMIVANATAAGLRATADRARRLVRRSQLTLGDEALEVTVSIGGTLAQPGDTLETLITRADMLMYRSKTDGRDRVTLDCH